MGRYRDFAYVWYIDTMAYSAACPYCNEKSSYRRNEINSSGLVRCKKCESMFRLNATAQSLE